MNKTEYIFVVEIKTQDVPVSRVATTEHVPTPKKIKPSIAHVRPNTPGNIARRLYHLATRTRASQINFVWSVTRIWAILVNAKVFLGGINL